MRKFLVILLCALFCLPAAASAASRPTSQHYTPVRGEKVVAYHKGSRINGTAAWYGGAKHVRTSSGERFADSGMTAAHRTMPFGTKVKVMNRRNGRSVFVTINDRGPMTAKFCIDLSRGAAARIGMVQAGTAPVELEIVELPDWYVRNNRAGVIR